MKVLTLVKQFPYKPWNPAKPNGTWSTSDLFRACQSGSIMINGEMVDPNENLEYVHLIVFFPSSNRKTTFQAPAHEFWIIDGQLT